jgi:hypothetical protein
MTSEPLLNGLFIKSVTMSRNLKSAPALISTPVLITILIPFPPDRLNCLT